MGKVAKKLSKGFFKTFHKVIPKEALKKTVGNSTVQKVIPQQALNKLTVGGRYGVPILPFTAIGALPGTVTALNAANSGPLVTTAQAATATSVAQQAAQGPKPPLKGFSAPENVPVDPVTQSTSYQALLARARRVVKSNNPATLEGPLAEALSAQRRLSQNDQTVTNFQNQRRQTLAAMIGKSLLGGAS